jgi:predicted nuclease of predicted toxin-antitoxin system
MGSGLAPGGCCPSEKGGKHSLLPARSVHIVSGRKTTVKSSLDLPCGNVTQDRIINQLSFDERRVVVSKDTDLLFEFAARATMEAVVGEDLEWTDP